MTCLRCVLLIALFADMGPAFEWSCPPARGETPQSNNEAPGSRKAAPATGFDTLKKEAESARESDRVPEAIGLYQQLVKLKAKWAEGWWYLGTLYYDGDQYSEGAEAFKQYVHLEPNNGHGWAMLGLCEFRINRYASALEHLARGRSLGLAGNEELSRVVRYHQAVLLTRAKQFELAQALLNGFAMEHRESLAVLDALGLAVLRISDSIDSLAPEQREMVRQFGKAAFLAGERKAPEARSLFDSLKERYRDQPNVAYVYGVWLLIQREPERAVTFFQRELQRNPQHVAALLQIAFHAIDSGKFEEAMPYALKAVEIEPENFAGHYALGKIYLEANDVDKAINVLEKSAALAPEVPSIQFVLARAYTRANRAADAARARAEFTRLDAIEKKRRGEATGPEASGSRTAPFP